MIGFSPVQPPLTLQDMLPPRLTVLDLLREVRFRPAGTKKRERSALQLQLYRAAQGRN